MEKSIVGCQVSGKSTSWPRRGSHGVMDARTVDTGSSYSRKRRSLTAAMVPSPSISEPKIYNRQQMGRFMAELTQTSPADVEISLLANIDLVVNIVAMAEKHNAQNPEFWQESDKGRPARQGGMDVGAIAVEDDRLCVLGNRFC